MVHLAAIPQFTPEDYRCIIRLANAMDAKTETKPLSEAAYCEAYMEAMQQLVEGWRAVYALADIIYYAMRLTHYGFYTYRRFAERLIASYGYSPEQAVAFTVAKYNHLIAGGKDGQVEQEAAMTRAIVEIRERKLQEQRND